MLPRYASATVRGIRRNAGLAGLTPAAGDTRGARRRRRPRNTPSHVSRAQQAPLPWRHRRPIVRVIRGPGRSGSRARHPPAILPPPPIGAADSPRPSGSDPP
ncbi:hypothetical protein GCM10010460_26940 [Microbacterium terrae]|nr:hypothetical protein GCM10017594_30820 [Microbacterium terrae]